MKDLTSVDWVVLVLVIIGAINWGLVGFFNFNLVDVIFHTVPVIARIVYAAVGLGGVYLIFRLAIRGN